MKNALNIVCFLTFFLSHTQSFSQTASDDLFRVDLRKNIDTENGTMIFYTLKDKADVDPIKQQCQYFWFANGKVQTTYGGVGGEPLNGQYMLYHKNGNLAESGFFDRGLKTGKWMTWYESGIIKATYNWKDGLLSGAFEEYDAEGKLAKKGTYVNGLLNGKVLIYKNGKMIAQEKYKNGVLSVPKMKSVQVAPADSTSTKK